MKNRKKKSKLREAKKLLHIKDLTPKELAFGFGRSEKTIYRMCKGTN